MSQPNKKYKLRNDDNNLTILKFKPNDIDELKKWVKEYCNGDRTKQPIGDWDVSHITNMSSLFQNCYDFNEPLDQWNVSNVTTMDGMFFNCKRFNQPLNTWNVSNVIDMEKMFSNCKNFNQPLNRWDVSNVTTMFTMFNNCYTFNQPLNRWNVSNVIIMEQMFHNCLNFNQPLNRWDVSNVTNMLEMFHNCIEFNQPLNLWNVSNVTKMTGMFKKCYTFNQPLNTWNVSNVIDMEEMFHNCIEFNQPLDRWNVSNVIDMSYMFYDCREFNQPLNRWDVSNVKNMDSIFYNCSNFNQPLNTWNVSNVIIMEQMFVNCSNFNQPLDRWNVSNVTNMSNMFSNCIEFNQPLNTWNVSNVTNMSNMFYNCKNFNQPLNTWNVSNVTNMSNMFSNCKNFNQPLDTWNVFQVINMNRMFYKCESFNQSLNTWKINKFITWENVSDQPLILNSHPTISQLKLKDLIFPDNKEWNEISNYFESNNPWLIHIETFEDLDYPIVTLPKGMMLYTYSTNKSKYNETFLFNLHDKKIDVKNSLKFFFPIPYAIFNLTTDYNTCNIVTLSRDIRILALISPSPIYRSYARQYKYYQKKYLNSCKEPFDHDLCIDFKLKQHLNIEGFIAIPINDSISHNSSWNEQLCNEKNIPIDFVSQLMLKSCISNNPESDIGIEYEGHTHKSVCLLNSTYKTKITKIKKVFSVPEIVLSPFSNQILTEVDTDFRKLLNIFKSRDLNKQQTTFNYKKLEIKLHKQVKTYLDSIETNIVESNQCTLFNLYLPECDIVNFPFYRSPKMYNELTREDVNWLQSYQTQSNVIAFNTVLYELFKMEDESMAGGNKKKLNKTKKKINKTKILKTKTIKNKYKKKGGDIINTKNELLPLKTNELAPLKTNNLLPLKTNELVPLKTNNLVPLKTNELVPLKTNNLVPLKTNELNELNELNENLEKNKKPTLIFELSNIGIPILYWKKNNINI
jgi:surface protein